MRCRTGNDLKKSIFWEKVQRGHYLYFMYYYLYTKIMDKKIAGISMEVFIYNRGDEIFPVQSLSYRMLRKAIKEIEFGENDVFVDVGCGMGRLLGFLFLNGKKGKMNYGIEINKDVAEFAKSTFKRDKNVEILYGDATGISIKDATVFFLFNPFGESVLHMFLDNLENSVIKGTRIYYFHAIYENVFKERRDKWINIKRVEVKPKYHVPVILCEYIFNGN